MSQQSLFFACALAGALSVSAGAEEFWAQSGQWDIYAEPGLGCFIERNESDGALRIGIETYADRAFFATISPYFDGISDGQTYNVTFALDREIYEGQATGLVINGTPGYLVETDNAEFIYDIAKKYTLEMWHDGQSVLEIDLNGSYRALSEAVNCAEQQ